MPHGCVFLQEYDIIEQEKAAYLASLSSNSSSCESSSSGLAGHSMGSSDSLSSDASLDEMEGLYCKGQQAALYARSASINAKVRSKRRAVRVIYATCAACALVDDALPWRVLQELRRPRPSRAVPVCQRTTHALGLLSQQACHLQPTPAPAAPPHTHTLAGRGCQSSSLGCTRCRGDLQQQLPAHHISRHGGSAAAGTAAAGGPAGGCTRSHGCICAACTGAQRQDYGRAAGRGEQGVSGEDIMSCMVQEQHHMCA